MVVRVGCSQVNATDFGTFPLPCSTLFTFPAKPLLTAQMPMLLKIALAGTISLFGAENYHRLGPGQFFHRSTVL
jgi:hypothetical protein